ncbi:MAG TPA: glutamate--tRNA ligase [Syntrophorhabdaceae bacterium]|jgi:glutamyl-tRNA synthetase
MVKVRFAPSPTGYLHVGNMRTALVNYLFARKEKGAFVLRVEDTDIERSDPAFERALLDDLAWLGLTWDEGPYTQSERTEIYRAHAAVLLKMGLAYKCFCSKERLDRMREEALHRGSPPKYDGTCRDLPAEDAARREREGMPYVVRFRAPARAIRVKDLIHGEIFFPADHVDDFILLKQGLTPAYNFAVTVDDMLMGITHVMRGADHVSNTPKQIMLFQAFGQEPPLYGHHSLLTGADQKPLSKRHGATHIREFREMGILPEALVNYVAVIGRSVKKEIMDEKELIETFSPRSLSPSDSLFDMEKLRWFNREHIRRSSTEKLLEKMGLPDSCREKVALVQENAGTLAEIRDYLDIFEGSTITDESMAYLGGVPSSGMIIASLEEAMKNGVPSFDDALKMVESGTGLKKRDLFMCLRISLTGRKHGPPLTDIFSHISREAVTERISRIKERLALS